MRTLFLLALVALVGCERDSRSGVDPRVTDASRPLVFLTHPAEPPCAYRDASGAIVGTDVDLARRIAAKMGRKLVVEGVEFSDILPRLKTGTADFGIATITITEARTRDVDFSAPYDTGGACFIYRTDGKKPRMSQLASLRIGVEADTVEDLYISGQSIIFCFQRIFCSFQFFFEKFLRGEIFRIISTSGKKSHGSNYGCGSRDLRNAGMLF